MKKYIKNKYRLCKVAWFVGRLKSYGSLNVVAKTIASNIKKQEVRKEERNKESCYIFSSSKELEQNTEYRSAVDRIGSRLSLIKKCKGSHCYTTYSDLCETVAVQLVNGFRLLGSVTSLSYSTLINFLKRLILRACTLLTLESPALTDFRYCP